MPDIKISQLPAATTPLSGTEELPLVQGGVTSKATAQDIADLGGGGGLAIPTFSITPSLPNWAFVEYKNPRSNRIDSVTTQVSTYSLEMTSGSAFSDYYGVSGNQITAFSTDTEALGEGFLTLYNSTYLDASVTSISLPTVKLIVGPGTFNPYGSFYIDNPLITSVSLPALVACGSIEFLSSGGITSLNLSSLTYISGISNSIYSNNSGLTIPVLSFPSLININGGNLSLSEATSGITSVQFPNLTYFGGGTFNISLPSSAVALNLDSLEILSSIATFTISMSGLTTFGLPALKRVYQYSPVSFIFTGCSLDQTSVDNILVTLAALDGTAGTTNWTSGSVDIAGGNAAPSGTGTTAAGVLIARGISVTTN